MSALYTPTDVVAASAQEFDDGDDPSALNVNPLGEAAFNTATWAKNRVGLYRLVQMSLETSESTSAISASTSTIWGGGQYEIFSTSRLVTLSGDIVEITFSGQAQPLTVGGSAALFTHVYGVGAPGYVAGTKVTWAAAHVSQPFMMTGLDISTGGTLAVSIDTLTATSGGGNQMCVYGPFVAIGKVWRPNS